MYNFIVALKMAALEQTDNSFNTTKTKQQQKHVVRVQFEQYVHYFDLLQIIYVRWLTRAHLSVVYLLQFMHAKCTHVEKYEWLVIWVI